LGPEDERTVSASCRSGLQRFIDPSSQPHTVRGVSSRKRARRKARSGSTPAVSRPRPPDDPSRLEPVRRRARLVKITAGAAAAALFGASMALARVTYAGHAKARVEPLSIPQPLYEVVRRNLLQAGILAPATAPPDATTSTS
jgi:hypothetical protein